MPADMSKYRLCEIASGGHFFVHDAKGNDLPKIEAKLKELQDKVRRFLVTRRVLCWWWSVRVNATLWGNGGQMLVVGEGGGGVWSVL